MLLLIAVLAADVAAETAKPPIQVVVWGADWCKYCVKNRPTLERLNKTPEYDILFVDFDRYRAFAYKHKIYSIPYYFVVKDGKVVFKTQKLQELLDYEPSIERE